MRMVQHQLLGDKMEEAVAHYINTHHSQEQVHVDTSVLTLNVQEEHGQRSVVTVMHPQNYSTQLCRQVSISEAVGSDNTWGEELMDAEGKLAAIVAHLAQHSRPPHSTHQKMTSIRSDVDSTVMIDTPMRLFNGHHMEHPQQHSQPPQQQQQQPLVVSVPSLTALPPLPPLPNMKNGCHQNTHWFTDKANKTDLKENQAILSETEVPVMEMAVSSPAQHRQSKKSLPHKKRISKKLKRNAGGTTPQQSIVVIENAPQEEILPDNFTPQHATHVTHEVRPVLICQLCGDFYGDEQLKFFHHLKEHYEPHSTIIIENPVSDLGIDKMTNTCIVDNVSTLPESLVELSLENTLSTSKSNLYQPMKDHILYATSDKNINNKNMYSMSSSMEKEHAIDGQLKSQVMYQALDKVEMYSCTKCNATFKKQKQCEAHIREAHYKLDDMNEFSEPEDLMEGIHVSVCEDGESLLPHITVENGHVHQEHVRHWYMRNGVGNPATQCGGEGYCPVCPQREPPSDTSQLKEEVLQRMLEVEVNMGESDNFTENLIQENNNIQQEVQETVQEVQEPPLKVELYDPVTKKPIKREKKKFECLECGRVMYHRNSLLYHIMSHKGKRAHSCVECGKGFYTAHALKIHARTHNDDRPHKCEECNRTFRQWGDLKYHITSIHTDKKSYKCEYCGKEFARKYSLNIHRRIHTGERNYKCEYCHMSFRASSYRLTHMRTHTGEKPFKCTVCSKSFRAGGDLRRHELTHEKQNLLKLKLESKSDNEDETSTQTKVDEDVGDTKLAVVKVEQKEKKKNIKKITTMSTTKPAVNKSPDKKAPKRPARKSDDKKGYPNVTVNVDLKGNTDHIPSETFRNVKIKDVYHNAGNPNGKVGSDRELTHLRSLYRDGAEVEASEHKPVYVPRDNTDGRNITIYTQMDRGRVYGGAVSDLRGHIVDGREVREGEHGDLTDRGFLEQLTAMYNIPA